MGKRKIANRVNKAKKRGKKLLILLAVLFILWIVTLVLAPSEAEYVHIPTSGIADLELLYFEKTDMVISHPGFTLLYDEEHEQALWVAYHLTREELYGLFERKDNFRSDPSIPTESASLADYRGGGYDRGHLIPAADLTWSEEAMGASFYMSNMSPQATAFNRGIWSDLEAVVRNFADTEGSVYVVTGPVLTDGPYKTIGPNQVSIPNAYYKVILDYQEPELKAIGFVLPNEGSKEDLTNFATTVREVEEITGLDFFHRLSDPQEELLETTLSIDAWDFQKFQASRADREAFNANPSPVVQKTKSSNLYSMASGTLRMVLFVVKQQSLNLIELFIPKNTLKEVAPFLY